MTIATKGAKGDPHKIVITLSNLFTTPLANALPLRGGAGNRGACRGYQRVAADDLARHSGLADRAEENFRNAIKGSQGDLMVFFSNWLVGGIMGLGLLMLFWPLLLKTAARLRGD